ncbi:MAG: type IX secretion system membrane protein PorP/SprF [Limnohabitans sp.]|nr:type IX secretion system membrane protein PorP/SprF [Limnohabitans sp.]
MRRNIILFWFLLLSICLQAQQESQYTQYMYNTLNINPAYAGSRECLSILAMHRSQWVGLEGAPVTNTVTLHTPLGANQRVGIGASFINDRLGPSDENTISVDLSYNVPTSEKFKLAFGIKATANFFNVDFNKLYVYDTNEPLQGARQNIDNKFYPNLGGGLFFYSDKTYVGFSIPYMLEQTYYNNDIKYVASDKMHYHFIAGQVFALSKSVDFKPALMLKAASGAPLQIDLSGNFWFNNKLTLGVAYRVNAAASALIGFQISDSWLIGYAYDRDVTRLGNFNSGSHEIFLRYELFKNYDKVMTPRFF